MNQRHRTYGELYPGHRTQGFKLWWAQRDTRWDVYPQQQPVELIGFNWEGYWCPQPDGTWYKSPTAFIFVASAFTPDLRGEWVHVPVTDRAGLWKYYRAESRPHAPPQTPA